MLKIENLTKVFGKGTINEMVALDGVDFHAEPGDFVTIIGSNGAGKSTLMNSIAGVFPVDSGTIVLNGKDISGLPEHREGQDDRPGIPGSSQGDCLRYDHRGKPVHRL